MEKIVLHTCCAPCSSAIIEWMINNNYEPIIFFFNPNIDPWEEYEIRKAECIRYTRYNHLSFIDGDYQHKEWLDKISGMENEPERGNRCLTCFKIRLDATAALTAEKGLSIFATTLASSRWKNLEQISMAGNLAAQHYPGVRFWDKNWRKEGLSERRAVLIKEHDFYNQPYCGCEFSKKK